MKNIVVDTSCFIAFLRGDDRTTLPPLILSGAVVLSSVVKLELLAGVRRAERAVLQELLAGLQELRDFPPVELCLKLLNLARGRGLLGGIPDLMIMADCERSHSALFTRDAKLAKLANEVRIELMK